MVCIPRKEATSNERLGDLLDKCVRNWPDNDAIVYYDRDLRLSWRGTTTSTLHNGHRYW